MSGALRALDNILIDKCFEELGFNVEKGCEHRTIDKLNGKRYLVIEGLDHKNIPNQITVVDNGVNHSFYTSYKGKEYNCRRYNSTHGGVCESLAEFYF